MSEKIKAVGKLAFISLISWLIPFFVHAQTLPLDETTVKNLSLLQNLEIQKALEEQKKTQTIIRQTKSIYDTVFSSEINYTRDKFQQPSVVFGNNNHNFNYNASVSQNTPLGTEITASFLNQRNRTNSSFTTINPSYNTIGQIDLRQPMAKNFFGFATRKNIALAKKQAESLQASTQAQIQVALYKNLVDYWNYYWAFHNASFEKKGSQKALELQKSNFKKNELGLANKADVYLFEANYYTRDTLSLNAQNLLITSQQILQQNLALDKNRTLELSQTSIPQKKFSSLDEALNTAFEKRPDYQQLKKEIEVHKLKVSTNKNALWPEMDLVGTYALNGLDNTYGNALNNIENEHRQWKVGMEFSFPLQNRKARNALSQSKIDQTKALYALKEKELEIVRQVRETYLQLKNLILEQNQAHKARLAQTLRLKEEELRFEQGRTSSDLLIRAQSDLIEAQKLELKSQVDRHMAELTLQLAQGTILE